MCKSRCMRFLFLRRTIHVYSFQPAHKPGHDIRTGALCSVPDRFECAAVHAHRVHHRRRGRRYPAAECARGHADRHAAADRRLCQQRHDCVGVHPARHVCHLHRHDRSGRYSVEKAVTPARRTQTGAHWCADARCLPVAEPHSGAYRIHPDSRAAAAPHDEPYAA